MNNVFSSSWEEAVVWLRAQSEYKDLIDACYYDDPLVDAARRYSKSTEWGSVRRLLRGRTGSVLDIGAGRGIASYAFANDGWEVTALEPDPSAIVGAGAIRDLAVTSGHTISVVQDWGESLPFGSESFDLVHCRQVLHHAKDLGQLCREIGRVLRPNGLLLASREHVVSKHDDIAKFQHAHPLHRLYGGENAYLLSEYISAIQSSGIQLQHVLNPYESDINLYPDSLEKLKARWATKMFLGSGSLIPSALPRLVGRYLDTPGRLYTFFGLKVANG